MLAENAISATAKGARLARKDKNATHDNNTIEHDVQQEGNGEDKVTELAEREDKGSTRTKGPA